MRLFAALKYWWNGEMSKEDALAMVREQHEKVVAELQDKILYVQKTTTAQVVEREALIEQYKSRALQSEKDQVLLQKKLEKLGTEESNQLTAAQHEVVRLKEIIRENAKVLECIRSMMVEQQEVNLFTIGERIKED